MSHENLITSLTLIAEQKKICILNLIVTRKYFYCYKHSKLIVDEKCLEIIQVVSQNSKLDAWESFHIQNFINCHGSSVE